ncbi:MAG: hypothetical protein JXP73_06940, partial [Deltaproteobacteria bacterium]|nr:hypothetical protein [Deltaproteobacteria bacterium]
EGGAGGSGEGGTGGAEEGGAGGSGEGGAGGSLPPSGCTSPVKPENGSSGNVTDFSDYSTTTGKWGSTSNVYGSIYKYAGGNSSMTAAVDTTAKTLHATGTVAAGDYAGAGISFEVCATVVDFTRVQFTISGSIGKCDLELQIKTFDESPKDGDPPGGCESDCYGFPALRQIVVPSSTPTDVSKSLEDFSSWSEANAKQVFGLQWQVTGSSTMDGDAGATCDVDIQITNIKFLP